MQLNPSAPLPKPSPTQHLMRVIAAALNPVDHKPVESLPLVKRLAAPGAATPGLDFAGVVVKPAEGSTVQTGDVVFGIAGPGTPFAGGALSEYAVSGEGNCVVVPAGLDAVDAAAVGVAGLTAYQSILPHVQAGERCSLMGERWDGVLWNPDRESEGLLRGDELFREECGVMSESWSG